MYFCSTHSLRFFNAGDSCFAFIPSDGRRLFHEANKKYLQEETQTMTRLQYFISSDLVHAGVLAGLAMFMMFYFF